jgi:hypothetical protein
MGAGAVSADVSDWGLLASASLSQWCAYYREVCGLDVTVRGGAHVGLWIAERVNLVRVADAAADALLDVLPCPALVAAHPGDCGSVLVLTRADPAVTASPIPNTMLINGGRVIELPVKQATDRYWWFASPETALRPLADVLRALGPRTPGGYPGPRHYRTNRTS